MLKSPEAGEFVQARDWLGDTLIVRVRRTFESSSLGECFEGFQIEEELLRAKPRRVFGSRFVALPCSHILHPAKLTRIGHGKWDLELPDGTVERCTSQKAAKDRINELGLSMLEDFNLD